MNTEKVLGYILLGLGLICIISAVYISYQVFTDIKAPPEIFQMNNLTFSLSYGADRTPVGITIPLGVEIRKMLNICLYSIFLLLVLSAGSKIGAIGAQLIKTIKQKD